MFKNRRRAASNPAQRNQNPNASASASLAATKAFIRDRESNGALSSAAAAAALRTHVTTPTPVADTITKRMARKGSTSSQGSGSPAPTGLRRQSSSGSMTERSFRAPSPNRGSPVVGHHHDAPPVPAVPKDVPGVGVVHRRASSLEPPYRGGSPAGRGGGRGVSLDRGVAPTYSPGRGAPRVTSLQQVPEDEVDGRPASVNFSRPISPSSPSRPARGGHTGWFAAPVVNPSQEIRGGPLQRPKTSDSTGAQYAAQNTHYAIQSAASHPVNKHQIAHGVQGTRLSSGSMRAKPSGTSVPARPASTGPVDPKSPYAVYDPSTRTFVHKQDAMARHRELEEAQEQPVQQYVAQHAPPPKPHYPPQQQRKVHYEPVPYQPVRERSPSPPRRAAENHVQSHVEPAALPTSKLVEEPVKRPPTPPPIQNDPVLARRTSEDLAGSDIRPPVEAETSRHDAVTAPLTRQEVPDSPASPRVAPNQDSAYPRLEKPAVAPTTNTLAPKVKNDIRPERTHSLSPPRHTHFAPAAVELSNGVKHQPPPRSYSPAKSALKPSPPGSNRNSSPVASNGRVASRGASSEASDEGGTPRKRRTIRVSFEEQPEIAGVSAAQDAETPVSPTSGLGQSRWSTSHEEHDLDDFMKPRPILPSFGSIRDKDRRPDDGDAPEKVTETVSSSLNASVGSIGEPLESSSDHAVGGILAQDFAAKQSSAPQDPLPPEVTSVEGSGYISDSDSSDTPFNDVSQPTSNAAEAQTTVPEPKTLTTPLPNVQAPLPVPTIAIQPGSPSPKQEISEPIFQRPFVPGGWDDEEEVEPVKVDVPVTSAPTSVPVVDAVPAQQTLFVPVQDNDDSDDNSSIYSDAYEELDEDEGGFASIDAVVSSPITGPSSGSTYLNYSGTTEPESHKTTLREEITGVAQKEHAPTLTDEWGPAQQHWSGVVDAQKEQKDVTPTLEPSPIPASAPVPMVADVPKPRQPKTTEQRAPKEAAAKVKQPLRTTQPSQPSQPSQPASQPRKSALKKSTPVVHPIRTPEPQMRKTMRGGSSPQQSTTPETHMRKSMRNTDVGIAPRSPTGLAASRYSTSAVETKPAKGALQKKHLPAAAAAAATPRARPQSAAAPVTKPLATAPTYDSDSDASASSFQRSRPRAARGANSRYSMRSSMRGAPAPSLREAPTMRSIPPPAPSSPPPSSFRKSMRPSSPTPEPSAPRSSRFSLRSLSPAGRFKPSKTTSIDAPPTPVQPVSSKVTGLGKSSKAKALTKPAKSKFQSRFADSSDEDDDAPRSRFQSRFADSDEDSDYELPPGLAPVRGIPRRAGDEDRDSTDLEDEESDAEPSPKPKDIEKGGAPLTNGNNTADGGGFAATSLRKSKHAPELPSFEPGKKTKKRGFFGFGGKKKASEGEPSSPTSPTFEHGETTDSQDIPMPPAHHEREAAAERNPNQALTPINEDKEFDVGPLPRTPKLQRRSTPQWGRSASDSWPLPQQSSVGGEDGRPQSSDGVPARKTSLRPALNKRVSSQSARTAVDPKSGKEVVVGRTGKKKKFQGLRRVFGLND